MRERLLAVLAWLWLLVAIPFLTDIGCDLLVGFLLFFTWLLMAVGWIVLAFPWRSKTLSSRLWWFGAGIAGCMGVGLAVTDVGLTVRVALSQPWLDAYAAQVPANTHDSRHKPRWVGLFRVDGTENEQGVVFLYTSQAFINREGLVYLPPGSGAGPFGLRYVQGRLSGPWHRFWWKF
jgi:hypothetical protein